VYIRGAAGSVGTVPPRQTAFRIAMGKEHEMTKLFSIGLGVILLAAAACAEERIDGKITAIDAAKGTIDVPASR
jgi:hypothetical protein